MDYICTWIYLDAPEERSEYPQVGKRSDTLDFQAVYWRCVAVFYALSTRFNPNRKHILFSNQRVENFPRPDGFDLAGYLKSKNVEIVTLPLTWQTPPGYFGKWRNQFYIFDILQFFEHQLGDPDAACMVLDSDCLVNRPLDGLFAALRKQGLMVLPMHFADDYNINGLTRPDMRRLFAELDGGKDPGENPEYCGGEIFAATLPVIQRINALAPGIWQQMLERHRAGQPKFNEEAHLLSYLYHRIGHSGVLNGFIKRIWTSPKYNNLKPEDAQLPIWHLPAEKTGGIALLFRRLKQSPGWFEQELTPEKLGGYAAVPRRTRYADWRHFFKHTRLYRWLNRLRTSTF